MRVIKLIFIVFLITYRHLAVAGEDTLLLRINELKDDTFKVNSLFRAANKFNYFNSKERIDYYINALNVAKTIQYKDGIIKISNSLITNLTHRQLDDLALEYCTSYLKYLNENNWQEEIPKMYKIYAVLLSKQGKLEESLKYNYKALNYYQSQKDDILYATVLSNISLLNLTAGQTDSAFFYAQKAAEIFKANNKKSEYANSVLGIAEIQLAKKSASEALNTAKMALNIYSDNKIDLGLIQSHFIIGKIYKELTQYDSASAHLRTALSYLKAYRLPELSRDVYKELSESYHKNKQPDQAYEAQLLFSAYNDSVSEQKLKAKTLEIDARYHISSIESELRHKEDEIRTGRLTRNYLILIIVISIGMLAVVYRSFIQKKKSNQIISEQKKLVDEKQKEILDSIQYAKRIQNTLLAHTDFINKHIPENFILFQPKDIVSGDFYWATFVKNKTANADYDHFYGKFYLAVCDSTGHGVPGAFMSLLNINFLNEAINEKGIERPDEVFNFVRERLIKNISKEGQKDGFDGILLCIETLPSLMGEGPRLRVTYAAANNTPILVANNQIKELPADRMPVGIGERNQSFTMYTIELSNNDTLYLYTDGYADQFGGPKGKKFKYKQLNELLLSNASKPLAQQKKELEDAFSRWKGELEQVDDVCLIGIRL